MQAICLTKNDQGEYTLVEQFPIEPIAHLSKDGRQYQLRYADGEIGVYIEVQQL